jgi:hypothetical protein
MRVVIALVLFGSAVTGCGIAEREFAGASGSGGMDGSGAFAGSTSGIEEQAAGAAGQADGSGGYSAGAGGYSAGAGGYSAGAGGYSAGAGGHSAAGGLSAAFGGAESESGGTGEVAGAGGADMCAPNATQCDGVLPKICDDQGQWVTGSVTVGLCGVTCKPGNVTCDVNDLKECQSDGTWQTTTCANGCLNAQCRDTTYGTVGVAGTFTCNVLPRPVSCSTGNICCYSPSAGTATCTTSCIQNASTDNLPVLCDGPNDCATGQVCCYEDVAGSYVTTKCETAACPLPNPASTSSLVCDPLGAACSKGICKLYAGGSKRLGAPLYTCQ